MKFNKKALTAFCFTTMCSSAFADPGTAELCSQGTCTPIEPVTGAALITIMALEDNINENVKAMNSERGELAKIFRVTGVSVKDIRKYGICGGKNSDARNLFKSICPDNVK